MNQKEFEMYRELFDAFFVAEALADNNQMEFAKFARKIVAKTPKDKRDYAYNALIAFIKSNYD